MAPRRPGPASKRRCPRVRELAADRKGRRHVEERRLSRELDALLQHGRRLGPSAFTRMLWRAINYGVENGVLQVYSNARPNQLSPPPAEASVVARAPPAGVEARTSARASHNRYHHPRMSRSSIDTIVTAATTTATTTAINITTATVITTTPGSTRGRTSHTYFSNQQININFICRNCGCNSDLLFGLKPTRCRPTSSTVGCMRRVVSFVLAPFRLLCPGRGAPARGVVRIQDSAPVKSAHRGAAR